MQLSVAHLNYQQATVLYNITQNSFPFKLPFFLVLSISLSVSLSILVKSVGGYGLMHILALILICVGVSWIACAIKWTYKLGSSLTEASAEHKRVYKVVCHKLTKEGTLRLKSWRPLKFPIGKTLEVTNQEFLTVMNDYVMDLFATLLLG